MAKRNGFNPFILLSSNPGDDIVTGGGSGQSGSDPISISYQAWLNSTWCDDYVPATPGIDEVDYVVWFFSNDGFTMDDFNEVSGLTWNDEWLDYLD